MEEQLFSVSDYDKHPEGVFPAQIVGGERCDGNYGPQVRWTFETDQEGFSLNYYTSTKIHPMSKMGMLLEALGARLPRTNAEAAALKPDALVGKCCRVRVEHRGLYANIVEVLPLERAAEQASVEVPDNYDPFA